MLLNRSLLTMLAALSFAPVPVLAQSVPSAPPVQAAPSVLETRTSIANLLPKDTSGVVLINTDRARWEALSQFGLFPRNFSFPGFLYPVEAGVNFTSDVQPWLGDQIGFALVSKNLVTIASVKDASAVNQFVDRTRATRRKPPTEQQYKGVTILEWAAEPSEEQPSKPKATTVKKLETYSFPLFPLIFGKQKLAIAVLPNYVVSSYSKEAIQGLIDAQTGERLSSNGKFQRTMNDPRATRSLFVAYGNYADILKATTQFNQAQLDRLRPTAPKIPQLDPNKFDALSEFYDTISAYVWAQPDGLHTQAAISFKQPPPQDRIDQLTTRNQLLDRLPEINYITANGQNLALYWQSFVAGLESQPFWKEQLAQFRKFSQATIGIDDRDIFPWMNGEIASFAYPSRQGLLPTVNIDWAAGVMVQTSDRAAAEAMLSKLNQFAKSKLGTETVRQRTIAGQPATDFSIAGPPGSNKRVNFASVGWLDANTLLFLGGGGAIDEFLPKPKRTLPQSVNFQAAMNGLRNAEGLPNPADGNLGYFYLNNGALMAFVNTVFLSSMGSSPSIVSFREAAGSIRSASASSSITPQNLEFKGFLSLTTRSSSPR